MNHDLTDYYSRVGYYRGAGFPDGEAHAKAEEATMEPNMENILTDALAAYAEEAGTEIKTRTYEDAGLLTRDKGLVVEVEGSTFQLTIVRR